MKTCPDCKQQLNDNAEKCYSCGYDFSLNFSTGKKRLKPLAILAVGLIVCLVCFFIYLSASPSPKSYSADSILNELEKRFPIVNSIVYDEDNDPNELIGKKHEYIGKVNWCDARLEQLPNGNCQIMCGGSIEVFSSPEDANDRIKKIEETIKERPEFEEYRYLENEVYLLRISNNFTPDEAEEYHQTFKEILSGDKFSENSSVDLTTNVVKRLSTLNSDATEFIFTPAEFLNRVNYYIGIAYNEDNKFKLTPENTAGRKQIYRSSDGSEIILNLTSNNKYVQSIVINGGIEIGMIFPAAIYAIDPPLYLLDAPSIAQDLTSGSGSLSEFGVEFKFYYSDTESGESSSWVIKPENAPEDVIEHPTTTTLPEPTTVDLEEKRNYFIETCETIPYKDLARNPNDYIGTPVKFKGEVLQIVSENDLTVELIVNISRKNGSWDETIYVIYNRESANESRILKGDIINIYGTATRLKSYTALSGIITIPKVTARYIDILE